jgi:hypothetical protein
LVARSATVVRDPFHDLGQITTHAGQQAGALQRLDNSAQLKAHQ